MNQRYKDWSINAGILLTLALVAHLSNDILMPLLSYLLAYSTTLFAFSVALNADLRKSYNFVKLWLSRIWYVCSIPSAIALTFLTLEKIIGFFLPTFLDPIMNVLSSLWAIGMIVGVLIFLPIAIVYHINKLRYIE